MLLMMMPLVLLLVLLLLDDHESTRKYSGSLLKSRRCFAASFRRANLFAFIPHHLCLTGEGRHSSGCGNPAKSIPSVLWNSMLTLQIINGEDSFIEESDFSLKDV
jgi:hypothetical protein